MPLNATSIILQVFFFLGLVLLAILCPCCKRIKCVKKLQSALFWNGLIRLMMEAYLELLLTSILNMKYGEVDPKKDSTQYAMVLSKVIFSVLTIVPPVLFVIWWKRREHWNSKDFKAKYGSLLEGITLDK